MLPLIVTASLFGVVAAAFATLLRAAARAGGSRASVLATTLALGSVLVFRLPFGWIPTPSRVAAGRGLLRADDDRVLYAVVIAGVAAAGYLVARRAGLVRRIRTRLERPVS